MAFVDILFSERVNCKCVSLADLLSKIIFLLPLLAILATLYKAQRNLKLNLKDQFSVHWPGCDTAEIP